MAALNLWQTAPKEELIPAHIFFIVSSISLKKKLKRQISGSESIWTTESRKEGRKERIRGGVLLSYSRSSCMYVMLYTPILGSVYNARTSCGLYTILIVAAIVKERFGAVNWLLKEKERWKMKRSYLFDIDTTTRRRRENATTNSIDTSLRNSIYLIISSQSVRCLSVSGVFLYFVLRVCTMSVVKVCTGTDYSKQHSSKQYTWYCTSVSSWRKEYTR